MKLRLTAGGLIAAALAFAQADSKCSELESFRVPGLMMEITKTEQIAAGTDGSLPAYCRAEGVINRRTGVGGKEYGIGFAIALPDKWNHDFLMQGGGALNGSIQSPIGAQGAGTIPGLARGFAVVSTDTGHKGTGAFDASFMKDQQASLDFAYQAVGVVAPVAKQIITRFYGRPAAYSYFSGCSTGGREAMIMTQRYPAYFDGVVAGAPAMRTGFSRIGDRWAAVSLNRITAAGAGLSEGDKKLVMDSLAKRCDAMDGLRDGMIFDVKGCDFDPTILTCTGSKNDTCLTAEQAGAIKRAFAGSKDSRGIQVYPGFPFDTGVNAKKGIPGLLAPGPSPVGPPAGTEQDVDKEAQTAANPLGDSVATNLSTFAGHGGKLLFYHGVSDPWFSPLDTLEYYLKMSDANGGVENVMHWSRFYFVPGMGHCSGGEAGLDRFDMLGAVVAWVEQGTAPASVIATGKAFPGRSRPLCAYPQHAQYAGSGDPEDAKNFKCQE